MGTDFDTGATESLRLFYALWPDEQTRAALVRAQRGVEGRKTPPQNLHITLAFLGQTPSTLLPVLKEILTQLSASEIALTLDRLDYFKRKRIAWAGASEEPEALVALHHSLTQALAQHGIAFDHQTQFKPHLTLARDAPAPPDAGFHAIHWRANQVALVQSTATPEGICYQVLASQRLK